MNVAIDEGPLKSGDSVRGIGVYTRELIKATGLKAINTKKVDLAKFDIVHFTKFNPFTLSLPLGKPPTTKFVLTIYDLIPLIYPAHYPPGVKGRLNWLINKFLIKRNIDAVVTISETSKKDICRFIGINPEKVTVIYPAAPPSFKKLEVTKKYDLPDNFALYVGDVNYNKNIPLLLKACKLSKIPLVVCGEQAKKIEKLNLNHPELKHLKGLDWSGVTRLGFVGEKELVDIYNLAKVYVQPSIYEGFGLPAVQAVACGTPLAIAKSQCMVEVLGEDFNYCDAGDADLMAKAITNPNKNKKLPRNYSWVKTAEETLNIYRHV